MLAYASSSPSDAEFGVLLSDGFHSLSTGAAIDLSPAAKIVLGNNKQRNKWVHLLQWFEIYSSFITPNSSPSLADILASLPCLNLLNKPLCSDVYVEFPLDASNVSG